MLIGWCTPLLIVLLTVILNFTTDLSMIFYGESEDGLCMIIITSHRSMFIGPVAASIFYNSILLVFITVYLCKSAYTLSKLSVSRKDSVFLLRLNIAVFFVSGITWIFGLLGFLTSLKLALIPYYILFSTQGFALFVPFLCTKRVASLYVSLLCRQKMKSSSY